MLNFFELIKLVDNQDAIEKIREAFIDDFREELDKAAHTPSARKKAVETYVSNAYAYGIDGGVSSVSNGKSAIFSTMMAFSKRTTDATPALSTLLKSAMQTQKPVEFYARDTECLARALGWKPGKIPNNGYYHVVIDGTYYDYNLVYSVWNCLECKDADIRFCTAKMDGTNYKMLVMFSRYGVGIVLPNAINAPDVYNVDFFHYMHVMDALHKAKYGVA